MTDTEEHSFSPFFKVRKVIWSLRYGFGFPLTSTNDNLTQFKFTSCVELVRYVVFWIIFCATSTYGFYIFYKCTNISNPILSTQSILSDIGLSYLDLGVIHVTPFINHIFNMIYIYYFKNGVSGLNKILFNLTMLNEEFHKILLGTNNILAKTKISRFYLHLRNFYLFIMSAIASGMFAYSYEKILFKKYPNVLSLGEKASLFVILFISNIASIYPPMAKSADFVVGHLLDETKDLFGYFNLILGPQKKTGHDKNSTPIGNHLNPEHSYAMNNLRYDM